MDQKQDTALSVRVPLDMKKSLEKIAAKNMRNVTQEIRLAIQSHIQKNG